MKIDRCSWRQRVALVVVLSLGIYLQSSVAEVSISPSNTGAVTWMPAGPLITDLDGTKFIQHSSSNFTVQYELPTDYDWDGVMIR